MVIHNFLTFPDPFLFEIPWYMLLYMVFHIYIIYIHSNSYYYVAFVLLKFFMLLFIRPHFIFIIILVSRFIRSLLFLSSFSSLIICMDIIKVIYLVVIIRSGKLFFPFLT